MSDSAHTPYNAGLLSELLDKQALYENVALYCRGQDRKDLELMKSTFWPEATDNHGKFVGSAHDFCTWSYENHKTTKHSAQHYITNVLVDLDGDTARRETAFVYVMLKPTSRSMDVIGGRYRDTCERRDEMWKVLSRVVIFDHAGQVEWSNSLEQVFGGVPSTLRTGDVFPNDPIHEPDW